MEVFEWWLHVAGVLALTAEEEFKQEVPGKNLTTLNSASKWALASSNTEHNSIFDETIMLPDVIRFLWWAFMF